MKWEFLIENTALVIVCVVWFSCGKMMYDKVYIKGVRAGRMQILNTARESIDNSPGALEAWAYFTDKVQEEEK